MTSLRYLFLSVVTLLTAVGYAAPASAALDQSLRQANQAYTAGKIQDAYAAYRSVVQTAEGSQCAAAWYNTGTAAARVGRAMEALACLDAALRLDPSLSDARINRSTILARLAPETRPSGTYADSWLGRFSSRAWWWTGVALWCAAAGSFAAALWVSGQRRLLWRRVGAATLVSGFIGVAWSYYVATLCRPEVWITQPGGATAWAGPGSSFAAVGQVPEGQRLAITDGVTGDYVGVHLENGRNAYVLLNSAIVLR